MNTAATIAGRLAAVQDEIRRACERAHRSPEEVSLIAVSKTHAAAAVVEAIRAGQRRFGENRPEEAAGKMAEVAQLCEVPVEWHLIGHVQSRKARYAADGFALLHSLDSLKLAERLDRILSERDAARLDVLLEINVSGEASKEGWHMAGWRDDTAIRHALWDDAAALLALPQIRVRGLMTMAPLVDDPEQTRPVFAELRALRDALAQDFPAADWSQLSMGMSDDYPVAVEEGATLVRVGRSIFGTRSYK
ncbi:YggS family pyridoxal phosphate-dependent enzyme [Aggregatilinea lenta]|uniref:YggS family pyridoxal phosphate-dependent enzyme n=1 Tax=Aggregatilinea lenta TaxID=913108 RepID=UPI000E5B7297|nr:YggS family pyridoxal phosphate-dependent enzyme [Aggregatilinea lenta]